MGRALAVIIWILTLGSVCLFFVKKWWFPTAISEHAAALDRQFLLTIIVVGMAFTAAQVGLGYMVWKYRDRGQTERALYSHGSNRLEVIWTIVTAVIFIGLAVMGQSVWASLHFNEAPPRTLSRSKSWRSSFNGTFITREQMASLVARIQISSTIRHSTSLVLTRRIRMPKTMRTTA